MAQKKKVRKSLLATLGDYRRTFETDHGRRVLWDLMKNSGMLGTSFVPNDPYTTCYNEGGRAVVLDILKKLNTNVSRLEELIETGHESDDNIYKENLE